MSNNRQQTACLHCGAKIDADAMACPSCGEPHRPSGGDRRFEGIVISDKYHVKSRIARGGMGEVYLAEHREMRQPVAVKFLHRRFAEDEGFAQRFLNEARYAGKVSHPNAVRLFDFGKLDDGTLYMIMEFVRGRCLTDIVDEMQMLPINMAVRVAAQVAEVLASAHELRIIHRDVKPDNIMLVRTPGGRFSVKVLDFGIAKVLDESESMQTETGVMFGTPEYMSPEQASGKKVDQRSDIYSLGLVLYFMLAGSPPFHGKNKLRIIHQQAREVPDPVEVRARQPLPRALSGLIGEMLAKNPDERPQRMVEVFRRLEEFELNDTTSFEEARARSAVYKIDDAGEVAAHEPRSASASPRPDVAPSRGREPTRGGTDRMVPAESASSSSAENAAPARPSAPTPTSPRRHEATAAPSPRRSELQPTVKRQHVVEAVPADRAVSRIAGVERSAVASRELGSRGPLRDFPTGMTVSPDDSRGDGFRSSGRGVAVLVAMAITVVCVGGAGWMYIHSEHETPSLLPLTAPSTFAGAADRARADEESAEKLADEPRAAVPDEGPVEASTANSASAKRLEPATTAAATRQAEQSARRAAPTSAADSPDSLREFQEGLSRARSLVAAAKLDEARATLGALSPQSDAQREALGAVRQTLSDVEALHGRLERALGDDDCSEATSVARQLSREGGTHQLSRWRSQLRACDAQASPQAPSAGSRAGESGSTDAPRSRRSETATEDSRPSRTSRPAAGEAEGTRSTDEAPGDLPGDLDAPAQRSQPERAEEPTPTPSEPAPSRAAPRSEPAPVLPPDEL